ncbi:MAG: hypothetical protein JJU02_03330 [Cryomorphaceae bacterium]|nr:hypothetical protein [Cryomorphaceae bacterium]
MRKTTTLGALIVLFILTNLPTFGQIILPPTVITGTTNSTTFGPAVNQEEAKVEVNVAIPNENSTEGGIRINVSGSMDAPPPDGPGDPEGNPEGGSEGESGEDFDGESVETESGDPNGLPFALWVNRIIGSGGETVFSVSQGGTTNVGDNFNFQNSNARHNVAGSGRFYHQTQGEYTELNHHQLLWNRSNHFRIRHQTPSGTNDMMTFFPNGKIGIGTGTEILSGDFLFYVNGKLLTEEHTVKLKQDWPDYVFKEDYKMMSLEELEAYVKVYKHLPDMPTAEDVAENGVEIGATQAALLKHIEELTLRLIEMEKRLNELENETN